MGRKAEGGLFSTPEQVGRWAGGHALEPGAGSAEPAQVNLRKATPP